MFSRNVFDVISNLHKILLGQEKKIPGKHLLTRNLEKNLRIQTEKFE